MKNKKDEAMELAEVKQIEITSATVKDDFCNYSYNVLSGVGSGDTHSVKGTGIIDDDMRDAFQKLNVHLAAIDDVFKNSNVPVDNIERFHNSELTALYGVKGFKIKGNAENESVVLYGAKYITCSGDRMELETPKIPLDKLSSYEWWAELKEAIKTLRDEVEQYRNGKCTMPSSSEVDPAQLTIGDQLNDLETARV